MQHNTKTKNECYNFLDTILPFPSNVHHSAVVTMNLAYVVVTLCYQLWHTTLFTICKSCFACSRECSPSSIHLNPCIQMYPYAWNQESQNYLTMRTTTSDLAILHCQIGHTDVMVKFRYEVN